MEKIIEFFNNLKEQAVSLYNNTLVPLWPLEEKVPLWWVLAGIGGILLLVIIIRIATAKRRKKRNVNFYFQGGLYKTVKAKYKKAIKFPEPPVKEGYTFVNWCVDRTLKTPYEKAFLDRMRDLNLHARYEKEVVAPPVAYAGPYNAPYSTMQPTTAVPMASTAPAGAVTPVVSGEYGPVMENQELIPYGPSYYYDEIRYAMLSYERAMQFKKLGVLRKQIVAEMFEKDGVINLYLKLDPEYMQEKGYKVERYEEEMFSIVPCKKVVNSKEDLEEALKLVKETMTVNNMVKSGITFAQKPASTQEARESGFAFFVKNETVATSIDDYYRLLRAIVLSYHKPDNVKTPDSFKNKMILRIYKKGETLKVFLALDPVEEGLAVDSSYSDAPALIEVKTAEDCVKANEFIDKVMYRHGMVRKPERATVSLDDTIEKNCGFGYRIKN